MPQKATLAKNALKEIRDTQKKIKLFDTENQLD